MQKVLLPSAESVCLQRNFQSGIGQNGWIILEAKHIVIVSKKHGWPSVEEDIFPVSQFIDNQMGPVAVAEAELKIELIGQADVVKTAGSVIEKMIAKDKAVMVMGLGASAKRENQMPMTRMGVAALLRETFTKAKEYKKKMNSYKKDKEGPEPKKDLAMEALLPVLKDEMPMMIHCERRDDIMTAFRIADEFGLKVILDGATDAYKVVDEIKKRNIPVILEDLFRGAATFAVRHGMPEETALRAVTIDAAEIIGMADRIGSLEQGKDADILILRGHPFKIRSIPEAVFIDGKLVYKRQEGERLN